MMEAFILSSLEFQGQKTRMLSHIFISSEQTQELCPEAHIQDFHLEKL